MTSGFYLHSARDRVHSPAMCCVTEMEDALAGTYGGVLLDRTAPPADLSGQLVLAVRLSSGALMGDMAELAMLRTRGAVVVAYVFDAWGFDVFYGARRRLKTRVQPHLQLHRALDRLCLPFAEAIDSLAAEDQAIAVQVPLAADTRRAAGASDTRPIAVLGYGRQPAEVTATLSDHFNRPNSPGLFYHTDHMKVGDILDRDAHRRMFWSVARSASLALAYDGILTNPDRFPFSMVGQRWFESLAAGCVVIGRRPMTADWDRLFPWPEATLEAPEAPDLIPFIQDLLATPDRLSALRQRNLQEMTARHDWRHRFEPMIAGLDLAPIANTSW